jgi:dethiobiotin synthetase
MSKGIFITGTDTGVGKTYVAAGLIRTLKAGGLNVCPMKPAETGCRMRKGELVPSDTRTLMRASGVKEPVDAINPYRMRHPLAPAVAARLEGVTISRRIITEAYRKLSSRYDLVVVEGAGGVMVPVYKRYRYLDMMGDLNLPVLVVARPGLGTINHTLLTVHALRQSGLAVLGVVLNESVKGRKGPAERSNPEVIAGLGRVAVLGTVSYSERAGSPVFQGIADAVVEISR